MTREVALILVVFFLPFLLQAACLVSNKIINTSLIVDTSCTNITLIDVMFSGGGELFNLSIGALISTNPMSPEITVSLVRISLSDGAVLNVNSYADFNERYRVSIVIKRNSLVTMEPSFSREVFHQERRFCSPGQI